MKIYSVHFIKGINTGTSVVAKATDCYTENHSAASLLKTLLSLEYIERGGNITEAVLEGMLAKEMTCVQAIRDERGGHQIFITKMPELQSELLVPKEDNE